MKKLTLPLAILGIIGLLLYDQGYFKPTNFLKCKHVNGKFYLKIDQAKKIAMEFTNDEFNKGEQVKEFDVSIKENYFMLTNNLAFDPPYRGSKTDDIFPINRKSLKIYNPQAKLNLGTCEIINSKKNKI